MSNTLIIHTVVAIGGLSNRRGVSAAEQDVVDDTAIAVSTAQLALSMKELQGIPKGLHAIFSLLQVIMTVAWGCDHPYDRTFHDILLSLSTLVALAMH
jgi:hypothetical protein